MNEQHTTTTTTTQHHTKNDETLTGRSSIGDSSHISTSSPPTATTITTNPTITTNTPLTEELPGLPRLNYNLRDYKTKLIIVSSLLVIESSILPIALFYGLWFYTTLRHGIVFAIITAFFGLVTGADIPHEPLVRPLAIPVPLFLIQIGAQLLWTGWMSATKRPAPCRISSVAKGERTPPLVYTIVEDIVAVDGAAGMEYRRAFKARYEASARFRRMVKQQNWFWGWGALLVGVGTLVVIWTVPQEVAYGVGWGSPLVFATVWTITTVIWVRRNLRLEKKLWSESSASSIQGVGFSEMQQQRDVAPVS
ncbi:hypothetical protein B0T17DRAFT_541606 [Bombardia bombarda]|uniref:Uncharacterized protein n=1 Tax=Bombardia bombarda TaxID=252184 RepID=A0AA39WH66_9PEZI|nr:hypothetical protein B0T17DRAFT_541606 [Bombardia bombarda]